MQNEKWFKNKILYVNAVLFLVVAIFAVDTFSTRGSAFIRQAVAAVNAIGIESGGTVNYLSRFVGASGSNQIGDSIIYDTGTNVGIGTASPDRILHLKAAEPYIRFEGTGATRSYLIGTGDGNLYLTDQTAGYLPRLTITSAGNVGIGTSAPAYKLDVAGNVVNSNPSSGWIGLTGDLPGNGTGVYPTLKTNGSYLYHSAGGAYTGYIGPAEVGFFTAQTLFRNAANTAYSPVYASDYYSSSAGVWMSSLCRSDGTNCPAGGGQWTTSGTNIYNSNTGNVGIGTASPGAKLDVQGQIIGGFGAMTTAGTTDWNHSSNSRSGSGYTLLLGNDTNGPGPAYYFHSLNFEYSSKDGTGNVTQLAIPYGSPGGGGALYMRGRYSGAWSSWSQIGGGGGQWTTSGTNIYNSNTGNVGIGTTAPETKLDVAGMISSSNQGRFKGWYTSGTGRALEVGIASGIGYIYNYDRTTATEGDLVLGGATGTPGISIKENGNVGIGTTTPTTPLQVHIPGTANTVTNVLTLSNALTSAATNLAGVGILYTSSTGGPKARIVMRGATGTNNDTAISLQTQLSAAGGLQDRLLIDQSGNVGIGTTTPAAKLSVNGAIQLMTTTQPASPVNGMMWMQ